MPSTTIFEFTGSIDTIAGRTDSAGVGVPDWKSEERRMPHELFTSGIATPADGWKVVKGAAATMNTIVGSGSAKADLAFIPGLDGGQGKYLVRLDEVTKTVTLDASDPSNPRKDEIYLTVYDNVYDTSGRSLPRLGYRKGDAASSPVVPGPDAAWKAYILLATIDVPAGAADIQACTITDNRTFSALQTNTDHSALINLLVDSHTQYYNAARHTKAIHDALGIDAATVGGELPAAFADANHGDHGLATHKGSGDHDTRYYTETEVNSLLGGKANADHGDHGVAAHKGSADHDTRYYTEGEVNSLLAGKSDTSHGHAYLPLSGGTMSGNITGGSHLASPLIGTEKVIIDPPGANTSGLHIGQDMLDVGNIETLRADRIGGGTTTSEVGWFSSWEVDPHTGAVMKRDIVDLTDSPRFPGLSVIDELRFIDFERVSTEWREWGVHLDTIKSKRIKGGKYLTTHGDKWGSSPDEMAFIAVAYLGLQDLRKRMAVLEENSRG